MHYSPGRSNKHGHRDNPDLGELPELLTTREAAQYLRTTVGAMAQNRYLDRPPPYLRCGRKILYLRADLAAYLEACRTEPQDAPGASV